MNFGNKLRHLKLFRIPYYQIRTNIASIDQITIPNNEKKTTLPYHGVDPHFINKITSPKNFNGALRISEIINNSTHYFNQIGTVTGWARTVRKQNDIFIELSDGSCFNSMQVVVSANHPDFEQLASTNIGTSFKVTGRFMPSPAKNQEIEMQVFDPSISSIKIVGTCSATEYPLHKGSMNPEKLRELLHLRARTNYMGAITRVRNNLAFATHLFFQSRGFLYINTPCITGSDCEGSGEQFQVTNQLKSDNKKYDPKEDFFKKKVYLTVSGQLNVESYCSGLSNVYTFGPTFRAEESNTTRHLAEFWMVEPELAFSDLQDNMQCAEAYIKFCVQYILTNNMRDLEFFNERIVKAKDKDKNHIKNLENILANDFARLTYTEGVSLLENAVKNGHRFHVIPKWGIDLGSEHERYLAEKIIKGPLILYNYPKAFKAFYMKLNDDGETVQAMDFLFPNIGEIVGGSAREDRYEVLLERIKEKGLDASNYSWYLDLRKYGSHPHCGFGAGFERLVMLCTGVENVKDTIPFPRFHGHAHY